MGQSNCAPIPRPLAACDCCGIPSNQRTKGTSKRRGAVPARLAPTGSSTTPPFSRPRSVRCANFKHNSCIRTREHPISAGLMPPAVQGTDYEPTDRGHRLLREAPQRRSVAVSRPATQMGGTGSTHRDTTRRALKTSSSMGTLRSSIGSDSRLLKSIATSVFRESYLNRASRVFHKLAQNRSNMPSPIAKR